MTTRKVLTIASTKKRDNMALLDPGNSTLNFTTYNAGSSTSYVFCPTYRTRGLGVNTEALRESDTIYRKGYREVVTLSPNKGTTWKWRRIVFETRGFRPITTNVSVLTSSGWRRLWQAFPTAERDALWASLFEGGNPDWSTNFTAKVDTNMVKLHSDKIRYLRSGNDSAHEHRFRCYYPFEKNMTYVGDEDGLDIKSDASTGYAAPGMKGMGDVFIIDMFTDIGGTPPSPGVTGDFLSIRIDATDYWHEK